MYGVFFYTFIHLDFLGQKSYNKAQTELEQTESSSELFHIDFTEDNNNHVNIKKMGKTFL